MRGPGLVGDDGKIVGIEPFQTGLLADRLDAAAKEAGGVSRQLATIYDDIEATYRRIGIRLGPPPRVDRWDDTRLDDDVRSPLDTIASQAPGTAADIRRRVQMLYDYMNGKNPLNPGSFFVNGPLPDPQKVTDAVQFFKDHIDDSGGFLWSNAAQGADEVYDDIKDLSPSELDAFLAALTPDQLKDLNNQLGEGSSWWGGGDPDTGVQKNYAALLSTLPIAVLDNYRSVLTNLHFPEPALMKDQTGQWLPANGTLFGPNGIDIKHDLVQGQDGDCWFLSSLAAITERDPHFFENHIKQNPDGTYTALFYNDDGKPVQITVDNTLPHDPTGRLLYAGTPDNVLWVALYEKAYTVFRSQNDSGHTFDTYDDINGGWGGTGLHDLTGVDSTSTPTQGSSLAALAADLQKGQAIVTGTHAPPPNGGEFLDLNGTIVGSHAYSVESVDLSAKPPTITLLNPWGAPSGIQEITLTETQWKQYFGEYATNPIKRPPSIWGF
ncbi:C2 family cysteine protease [Catenulispora pinisilvae]|uniref:C2 family cysteine protease n=1 Tax=Catenulispora pinisilvae TaxID=2705253 RepID=UPI001890E459|nr:C2 family cysteine protease [Catenulispora pinisilvae]